MQSSQCNCSALRSAARVLSAAYDEALRPSGLRVSQFSILARTSTMGETPLSELASAMAMDRTTLGRNLQPLERDGLIQIKVGTDRRERLVSLTASGQRALTRAMPLWEDIHGRFERRIGKREARALRDMMKIVVDAGRDLSEQNAEIG